MRRFLFALIFCVAPVSARAQVAVHADALAQLAGVAPAVPAAPAPMAPRKPRHAGARKLAVKRAGVVASPGARVTTPMVAVPAVAPALSKLPFAPQPPIVPPVKMAVVKPVPPVPALPGAVVLKFADGSAALPGGAAASLRPICAQQVGGLVVAIDAYAPADANDPSVAMRLSLSRAFAVRDALTACGVPAARIIPRADGALGGDDASAKITLSRGAGN